MPYTTMKYSKTELGQQAFKERSPLLSSRQRSAFIMFDGEKPLEKVLSATAGLGVTQADIDHMVAQGFLVAAVEEQTVPMPLAEVSAGSGTPQERYAAAKPIATQLTASLGLRGFRLNLAVEAASGYDELLNLLPKIQEAVGPNACRALEQALKG
jgi:hypothetical protein